MTEAKILLFNECDTGNDKYKALRLKLALGTKNLIGRYENALAPICQSMANTLCVSGFIIASMSRQMKRSMRRSP